MATSIEQQQIIPLACNENFGDDFVTVKRKIDWDSDDVVRGSPIKRNSPDYFPYDSFELPPAKRIKFVPIDGCIVAPNMWYIRNDDGSVIIGTIKFFF
jgi:hypothetical protein